MSLEQNDIDQLVKNYREDFTPDVEQGLRALHGRLTPVRRLRPRNNGRLYAIAAAVLLLLTAGYFVFADRGLTELRNDTGQLATYELPDGSSVVLQSGSVLHYSASDFNTAERRLTLDGQGFFEVAPDADRPFTVSSAVGSVRVTGTAFNLRARSSELEVEVSEGTVLLQHAGREMQVKAREAALAVDGGSMEREEAPNLNHHAWRTGELRFDHTPFEQVLVYLNDNWGIVCTWKDDTTCSFPVTSSYHTSDARSVLEDIAELNGVKVRSTGTDGKHFELTGTCSK
ncbi:FecR family protein [Lewinella sp. IMCC34183]|uniref:FecR family protein n=1 Tax=Lewinella sp. IMCC34183 TaxID=2248762 RepID=UPI000E2652B2|nr:FecR domain-containing protein [Lewinella sp. IMCC34183]